MSNSETVLVDGLLSSHPTMKVKDKIRLEKLLQTLNSGGLEKLQVNPKREREKERERERNR